MKNNLKQQNNFNSYYYNLHRSPISKEVLLYIIDKFFEDIILPDKNIKYIHIQLRFMFDQEKVRSISKIILIKRGDIKLIKKQFLDYLEIRDDYYILDLLDSVVIYYKLNYENLKINTRIIPTESKNIYKNSSIIDGYKLPNTMDLWL